MSGTAARAATDAAAIANARLELGLLLGLGDFCSACHLLSCSFFAQRNAQALKKFAAFFHALLDRGVYVPPSQFEAAFVSLAMGEREVEHTFAAARHAFRAL